jgi:tetratricopeptide (TPR) repeat protein
MRAWISDDPVAYAEYLNDVGIIHMCLSDTPEARRWLEAARDLRVARGLPVDWRTWSTLLSLGEITRQENHTLEAMEIYRDVERQLEKIAPTSPGMHFPVASTIASTLIDAGRPFDAVAELVRCQTKFALVEVPQHQRFNLSWDLGKASRLVGDLPPSRTYLREAQALCPVGPTCWNVLHELMLTAAAEGDATAVQTYYGQISAQELDRANRMRMVREHARALGSLDAWPEAILKLERAQAMIGDPTEVIDATASWEVAFELGRAHRKIGDLATAERELAKALVELRALHPVEAPPHAEVLYELGELALDRRRWSEALGHLEEAESIFALTAEDDYLPRARTRFARARALTGTTKLASPEARQLAQAAIRGLRANSKHDEARVVEAWLEASG